MNRYIFIEFCCRLRNASQLYYNLNCNLLMVEYRGYGLSKGSPSEEGLCMDARAALDFLYSRQDVDHRQIIVFGRSLGKCEKQLL